MAYVCSQCHTPLLPGDDGDPPERCTNCSAEAGIEHKEGIPPAMRIFGMLVGGVIVAAMAGGLISRLAG